MIRSITLLVKDNAIASLICHAVMALVIENNDQFTVDKRLIMADPGLCKAGAVHHHDEYLP